MAQLGRDEQFEDPNAGVEGPEPQEAAPGLMGKIMTTFSNVKQRVSSPRTPSTQSSTPGGVETGKQGSKVEESKDSPRIDETGDVSKPPSRAVPPVPEGQSPPDQVNNGAAGRDTAGAGQVGDGVEASPAGAPTESSRSVDASPEEKSPPDQVRNDPAGLDTAGAGEVGDGVGTSPVGAPTGSSRSVDTGPEEQSPPGQVHNDAVGRGTAGAGRVGDGDETSPVGAPLESSRSVDTSPAEQSPPDQVHNDAVGLDTAGAGGRVGDGVETSPVGAPTGSARSVDTGASPRGSARPLQDGTSASPAIPKQGFGERIIDKLPGTNTNPYSVGNPTPNQAENPYTAGDSSAVPTSPSTQSRGPQSPGLFSKLKNMVTGQKPTQGTATENATTGTAEREPLVHGYTQEPIPEKNGDIFEKAKEKLGGKGPDAGSAEGWPAPAKPDMSGIPSATSTDAEGRPIEGPTQPKSEDTKKDGLVTKLMDKFHLHGSHSPRTSTATTGTPTTNRSAPTAADTGMPTYADGAPSNPEGQATGPVET